MDATLVALNCMMGMIIKSHDAVLSCLLRNENENVAVTEVSAEVGKQLHEAKKIVRQVTEAYQKEKKKQREREMRTENKITEILKQMNKIAKYKGNEESKSFQENLDSVNKRKIRTPSEHEAKAK